MALVYVVIIDVRYFRQVHERIKPYNHRNRLSL